MVLKVHVSFLRVYFVCICVMVLTYFCFLKYMKMRQLYDSYRVLIFVLCCNQLAKPRDLRILIYLKKSGILLKKLCYELNFRLTCDLRWIRLLALGQL